jgi:hypothetical protein
MASAFLELLTAETNLSTNLNDFRLLRPAGLTASDSVLGATSSSSAEYSDEFLEAIDNELRFAEVVGGFETDLGAGGSWKWSGVD